MMTVKKILTDSILDNRLIYYRNDSNNNSHSNNDFNVSLGCSTLKLTQYDLEIASSQGRLWLVKRCLHSGISITDNNNKALELAIKYGRIAVIEYLLSNGAVISSDMMHSACQQCHPRLVEILTKYYNDLDENCLITAIDSGCTSTVKVLLEAHVNPNVLNGAPILIACQYRLTAIIKLLIEFGANLNVQNGQALVEACSNGYIDVVELLVKHGVDVNVQDDLPLLEAGKRNHVQIMLLLLEKGADIDVLGNIYLKNTTKSLIDNYYKQLRIPRLKKAIRDSFKKEDFKWQEYCGTCGNKDLNLLQNQAKLFGIDSQSKTKREICMELAKKLEHLSKTNFDSEIIDFSGTPINELPFWKILVIDNIPFNCFDLFKLVKQGYLLNPYTKNKLPLEEIKKREDYLQSILTKVKFRNFNLLQQVKDSILLTKEQILAQKLQMEVWEKLDYPPSIQLVLDASDERLDEMVEKLENLISDRQGFSYSNIYHMINTYTIDEIKYTNGFEKKKLFVDLLSDMVNYDDYYQDTRCITLEILLKHFATFNNEQDDYTFITEYLEDDFSGNFLPIIGFM